MIKNAQVIDERKHTPQNNSNWNNCSHPTSRKGEQPEEFTIVGSTEADPLKSRISNVSPVGQALLGKKKGGEGYGSRTIWKF